jgi:protein-S-isoprenylcysteine O-methyltransferase Ste14
MNRMMTTSRFFDWFQFGVLAGWGLLGLTRALMFRRRGVKVITVDRQRTRGELAVDLLAFACLLGWAWEVIAHAWQFEFHTGVAALERVLFDGTAVKVAGAVLAVVALVLYAVALRHLGTSWRLGIDRSKPGPLVTGGVYARTRHPIYVAFDLLFIGTVLMSGRMIFLVLAVVWLPLMHALMRREERFLTQLYGDAYRDYAHDVGRYFTWRNAGRTTGQLPGVLFAGALAGSLTSCVGAPPPDAPGGAAASLTTIIEFPKQTLTFEPSRSDFTVGSVVFNVYAAVPGILRVNGTQPAHDWHAENLKQVGTNRFEVPPLRIEFERGQTNLVCLSVKAWFNEVPNQHDGLFYVNLDDRYALVSWCTRPPVEHPAKSRFSQNRVETLEQFRERLQRPFVIQLNQHPLSSVPK